MPVGESLIKVQAQLDVLRHNHPEAAAHIFLLEMAIEELEGAIHAETHRLSN